MVTVNSTCLMVTLKWFLLKSLMVVCCCYHCYCCCYCLSLVLLMLPLVVIILLIILVVTTSCELLPVVFAMLKLISKCHCHCCVRCKLSWLFLLLSLLLLSLSLLSLSLLLLSLSLLSLSLLLLSLLLLLSTHTAAELLIAAAWHQFLQRLSSRAAWILKHKSDTRNIKQHTTKSTLQTTHYKQ